MVKLEFFKAKNDMKINKSTFTKGVVYFSRLSKSGDQVLVLSNEGKWISFSNRTYAKKGNPLNFFDKMDDCILCKNYKHVRHYTRSLGFKKVKQFFEPESSISNLIGVDL